MEEHYREYGAQSIQGLGSFYLSDTAAYTQMGARTKSYNRVLE